ncbi:hypothetical protein L6452_28622 [Arctium lappa]|uniref:Uncharacterized protein n=1 Tax=Arctium lappa TaxID=4217 RepID=A0ACB8ZY16_ARCLA|nr:hypothetical protein L6452_28622 [Arctium lappa]
MMRKCHCHFKTGLYPEYMLLAPYTVLLRHAYNLRGCLLMSNKIKREEPLDSMWKECDCFLQKYKTQL